MPIVVDRNGNYGAPAVNQKYKPLAGVQYAANQLDYYRALIDNRRQILQNLNVFPRPLALRTANWTTTIAAEAGHLPPLVVVSSNRARWIFRGFNAAAARLQLLNGGPFADAGDLSALACAGDGAVLQSPPIYTPSRIGANRNVYIVVHAAEYAAYRDTLNAAVTANVLPAGAVTIVGWHFAPPAIGGAGALQDAQVAPLTGFGASRFAAIAFCKELRAAANPPWHHAWVIDDNVVAVRSFPGFAVVEAAMPIVGANRPVAAAFRGATAIETGVQSRAWAQVEIAAGRGLAGALPAPAGGGFLQQIVCWNIERLTALNINFSPIFVAAGEDVGLSAWLNRSDIPFLFYNAEVRKEVIAQADGSAGATRVSAARQTWAGWFAAAERAAGQAPPPPVEVNPAQAADGGVQTLSTFVEQRVLPACHLPVSPNSVNLAACQGVEQITSEALGEAWFNAGAVEEAFQVDAAAAPILRISG